MSIFATRSHMEVARLINLTNTEISPLKAQTIVGEVQSKTAQAKQLGLEGVEDTVTEKVLAAHGLSIAAIEKTAAVLEAAADALSVSVNDVLFPKPVATPFAAEAEFKGASKHFTREQWVGLFKLVGRMDACKHVHGPGGAEHEIPRRILSSMHGYAVKQDDEGPYLALAVQSGVNAQEILNLFVEEARLDRKYSEFCGARVKVMTPAAFSAAKVYA